MQNDACRHVQQQLLLQPGQQIPFLVEKSLNESDSSWAGGNAVCPQLGSSGMLPATDPAYCCSTESTTCFFRNNHTAQERAPSVQCLVYNITLIHT